MSPHVTGGSVTATGRYKRPGETLTVRVPSQSDPNLEYTLHANGDEVTCSCRGYMSHHRCKHQAALRRVLQEEAEMTTDNSTAVVKHEAPLPTPITALAPQHITALPAEAEFAMMTKIAGTVIQAAGMVPQNIKTPQQAMAVMLAGRELGLKPMTSLRHVYIVNGKTDIETRAMVGIVHASDPRIAFEWPEYTSEAVTCVMRRPGQQPVKVRYTLDDAKASGQYAKGGPWKSYTRDMLYAAATKRACRIGAPDLINAIDSAMQSVEAVGAAMNDSPAPDMSVRVLDHAEALPAEAYNDGDGGALPAEAQQVEAPRTAPTQDERRAAQHRTGPQEPVPPTAAQVLRTKLTALKNADADALTRIVAGAREAYPAAADGATGITIAKLLPEEQQRLTDIVRAALGEAVGDEPPMQGALEDAEVTA